MKNSSFKRTFVTLFFVVFSVLLSGFATNFGQSTDLWVGESKGILKLSTFSGDILFEVPLDYPAEQLSLEKETNTLWVYGNRSLKSFNTSGSLLSDTSVNTNGKPPVSLITTSSSTWLAVKKNILQFDIDGNLISERSARGKITGVTYNSTNEQIWFSDNKYLYVVNKDNELIERIRYKGKYQIQSLEFDKNSGNTWILTKNGYDLLDLDCALLNRVKNKKISKAKQFTVDTEGNLWFVTKNELGTISQNGDIDFQLLPQVSPPFSDDDDDDDINSKYLKIVDLALDAETLSIWLATKTTIYELALDGTVINTFTPDLGDGFIRTISSIDISSDSIQPEITIVSPENGSLINTPTPIILVSYFDQDSMLDTSTLVVKANDIELSIDCEFEETQASCLPTEELAQGDNSLSASIADLSGNQSNTAISQFTLDSISPIFSNFNPVSGDISSQSAVEINASLSEVATLSIDGAVITLDSDNNFSTTVNLDEGDNTFLFIAIDAAGNETQQNYSLILDSEAPVFSDVIPASDLVTNINVIQLSGLLNENAVLTINGEEVILATDLTFEKSIELNEGNNVVELTATDMAGNVSTETLNYKLDSIIPEFVALDPESGFVTNNSDVTFTGELSEVATLTLNDQSIAIDSDNKFNTSSVLLEGVNEFVFIALDEAGNSKEITFNISLDTEVPETPDGTIIMSTDVVDGMTIISGDVGSVEANTTITILNVTSNEIFTFVANDDGSFTAALVANSDDEFQVSVRDSAGNNSESISIVVTDGVDNNLPVDPITIAPILDEESITPFIDQVSFLFTGNNPIQQGANLESFDAKRLAVATGYVFKPDGEPLSGVEISIQGYPEYGFTQSRSGGEYDLALNGGQSYQVIFNKEGYLPLQRTVDAPWRDFSVMTSVVLTPLDEVKNNVVLSLVSNAQVARGSVVQDHYPQRQATLIFPSATTAEMVLTDGSTAPLNNLTVRATEFTVGGNGYDAMPADLPANSGYTYCVELSVDEAIEAGATTVNFSKPVPFYVENFIGFPIGETVPVGYFDRKESIWKAIPNGKVIKILSLGNDTVSLDLEGNGLAAEQSLLDEFGITEEELTKLAELYAEGDELWRVQVDHFTPYDLNWPWGPPLNALLPNPDAPIGGDSDNPDSKDNDKCSGCVIEGQTQTLRESIPVTGTPFNLNYSSNRVLGRKTNYTLTVPVFGETVDPELLWANDYPGFPYLRDNTVTVEVRVGGKVTVKRVPQPFVPFQSVTFEFDGANKYGQMLTGEQEATVKINYTYPMTYYSSEGSRQAFGSFSGNRSSIGRVLPLGIPRRTVAPGSVALSTGPRTFTSSISFKRKLGAIVPRSGSVGHWSIDSVHQYDANSQTLYQGNGDKLQSNNIQNVTRFIATQAQSDIAFSPDGKLYVARGKSFGYVNENGEFQLVLEDTNRFAPARFSKLAFAPNGELYSYGSNRIFKISDDLTVERIGGTGVACTGFCDEGKLAIEARISSVKDLVIAKDGTIYFSSTGTNTVYEDIRKIDSNGILSTIVKGPNAGPLANDIAIDSKDRVIYNNSGEITRVNIDGTQTVLAATAMAIPNLTVGPADEIYFRGGSRIWRLTNEGVVQPFVGSGRICSARGTKVCGVDDSSLEFGFAEFSTSELAFDKEGNLFFTDNRNNRILKVASLLPEYNDNPIVASRDGSELFVFDQAGKHLLTQDTFTKQILYSFNYDNNGLITSITDGDGDVTTIERNIDGVPIKIVSHDGHETLVTINSDGYLETVTNPESERWEMAYKVDATLAKTLGLLQTFTNPRNQVNAFTYDELGRLQTDVNPINGGWTLDVSQVAGQNVNTMTSKEGRATTFDTEMLDSGDRLQTNTYPDGSIKTSLFKQSGQMISTMPGGTVVTTQESADPRFGMQAPVTSLSEVKTPSGIVSTTNLSRTSSFAVPGDINTLTAFTENLTVNGNTYTSSYDAGTLTWNDTTPEGYTSSSTVDNLSRPLISSINGLDSVNYQYDIRGRLETTSTGLGVRNRTTQIEYYQTGPYKGYVQSLTDAESRVTTFDSYDGAGRVLQQTLPGNRVVAYGYDANGNLNAVTPPGKPTHTFEYTDADQESGYQPPDIDGDGNSDNEASQYVYNLDKQLELIIRADGKQIDFVYEAATGKLDELTIPRGSYDYIYANELDPTDTSGFLKQVIAPDGGSVTYDYDGILTTGMQWAGEVSGSVEFEYNNNLLTESISVNGANPITYTYDNDNVIKTAGDLSITRNAAHGLLETATLGTLVTSWGYNEFGELVNDKTVDGANTLYDVNYTRDKLGRIDTKTETIDGVTAVYGYSYWPSGFLQTVTKDGVVVEDYSYDLNGNRQNLLVGGANGAVYDAQDRLLSNITAEGTTTYTYNLHGDIETSTINGAVTIYNYDSLSNLISVALPDGTNIEYVTDSENRRVGKKVDGAFTQKLLYHGRLNPIAELDNNDNLVARFVYGIKSNLPEYLIKDGATYKYISDHLGSVRLLVNVNNGEIAQKLNYDAWGNVTIDTNPGFQPFGFAGGLYDVNTSLVKFGDRDYDPEVSRWLNKDKAKFIGGYNLYQYSINDPINYQDFDGNLPVFAIFALRGAALGAATALGGEIAAHGMDFGSYDLANVLSQTATGALLGGSLGRYASKAFKAMKRAKKSYLRRLRFSNSIKNINKRNAAANAYNMFAGKGIFSKAAQTFGGMYLNNKAKEKLDYSLSDLLNDMGCIF